MVLAEQNTLTHSPLRRLVAAVAAGVLICAAPACSQKETPHAPAVDDPEHLPSMVTRNVETLISDSGIMRYRVTAPIWEIYDRAAEPYWCFGKGVNLEKYDDFFRRQATVRADSAIYREQAKTWELYGNVRIENIAGERFLTAQLNWNQSSEKVYSDSFIRIEQPDRTLEGYGFISNDRLTTYSIRRVSGIFPAESLRRRATDVDSLGNPI